MEDKDKKPKEPRRMPIEDKVAFGAILFVIGGLIIGALMLIRYFLGTMVVVADGMSQGVGLRTAFLWAIGLSVTFMVLFALVAGDGVIGELTVMLVGFFVMLIFFTFSIAIIL
jgi:hypothetical protein